LALPVLTAAYVLPMGAALASGAMPWSQWTTGVLPTIARSVGGEWLGHAVAAGAVLSTAGLFMSLLLTNSRLPYVVARDQMMPRWLGVVDPRFGTPWRAIVVSAALYAGFAAFSFKELIVLNVWLYSLSLLVELAAFVRLRVVAPEMPRPWRVPGGLAVAGAVVACPVLFCLGAMATAGLTNTIAGGAAARPRAPGFRPPRPRPAPAAAWRPPSPGLWSTAYSAGARCWLGRGAHEGADQQRRVCGRPADRRGCYRGHQRRAQRARPIRLGRPARARSGDAGRDPAGVLAA